MAGVHIWRGFSAILFLQGLLLSAPYATANEERIVLVSTSSRIYFSKGPEFDFNQLPFSVDSHGGIDFDTEIGVLFWTDTSDNAIKRAELEDISSTLVISTGTSPAGIAVDGNEELIFWVHTNNSRRIERVTYNGLERRQLVDKYRSTSINYITLDRKTRTLYWTEGNSIRSSSYEGLNQRTLVSSNNHPRDFALNMDRTRYFWCEGSYVKTLDSSREGASATTTKRLSSTCRGVSWFEGHVYWTYGTRFLEVKDEETEIMRQIPISPSSLETKDIIVGRMPVQGLDGGECDFERIICKWGFKNLMSNSLTWSRQTAELAARNLIRPNEDHTTQNRTGHYLLLKTNTRVHSPGDTASIISPLVNATGTTETQCFRFWYYMHDVINGSLTVFFKHENQTRSSSGDPLDELSPIWSVYGSQPDEWVGAEVEVRASGVGRILIKAIVGDPSSNIIAIDDVHFGECRQDSRLVCGDSSMTVYLDKARLGIFNQDGVSFKNSLCRGVDHDADTFAITAPYNGCGTSVSESDDNILFSNQVNVMFHSDIRSSDLSIQVNCSLSRTYHVVMMYLTHAWIRYIRNEGYGTFTVAIRQYTNAKFEDAFPSDVFPQQVEIDDRIYMATEMVTIKYVVDTLHNKRCWATPSRDPSDPLSRDIIDNGCPTDPSTKVYTLLARGLQAFSFKAFSFSQGKNLIYVHCDIIICHESEESVCSANCSQFRRVRETRDTRDAGSVSYTVSQGPFISKMAAFRQGDVSSVIIILISALVCMSVLLLATIFVGIIAYARVRKLTGHN